MIATARMRYRGEHRQDRNNQGAVAETALVRGASRAAAPEMSPTAAFVEDQDTRDLQKQTTSGVGWAGLSRVGIQVVQFGSTVVLARLLLPAEFGLAAIITALIAFANLFSDLGLGAALIHRQGRLDERFLATAFWLNTLSGLALTGLFCAVSVPLANFFGHRQLVPLIIVGSLVFGLSMYTVHLALLEKIMRYRAVAIIEFSAAIVYFIVAVVAAVLGAGAMSLVLGSLAQAVCTTIAMWLTVRWRPRHLMDRKSLAQIGQAADTCSASTWSPTGPAISTIC